MTEALCCRCDLKLVDDYCPNPECPFHTCYQDECMENWTPPSPEERRRIADPTEGKTKKFEP